MKKDIMDRWVIALRSGKFEQAQHRLQTFLGNCCLGVLCSLASMEGVCELKEDGDSYNYKFDEDLEKLPKSVQRWAGINSELGIIPSLETNLASLNDRDNLNFNQIADIIEKHYKEL